MKARFFALAALVLGLASCQQEFDGAATQVGGEVDFQLKVDAKELATRADDLDGDSQYGYDSAYGAIDYLNEADWAAYDLRYSLEVYDVADNYTNAVPVKDRMVQIVDKYEPVAFDLRLVPNREYHFVVFADFVKQGASSKANTEVQSDLGLRHNIGDNLGQISIKSDAINDEIADAYFATKDIKITNSAAQSIVLRRPYGKVRVIATDLDELNLNVIPGKVKVVYDAFHPLTFNAVTGEVDGEYDPCTYECEYDPTIYKEKGGLQHHFYNIGYDEMTTTNANGVERHKYMTLFTDYILAENQGQTPYHFTMTVWDQKGDVIKETHFNTDIPVERNMLTTVVGNVLTTATEINVSIDDDFATKYTLTMWDGKAVKPVAADENGVYNIYEASELAWFAQQVNEGNKFSGKTVKLCKDIHLNGEAWTPIGATGKFEGTFHGQNHVIEGLFVNMTDKTPAGLFANAKYVKNLKVCHAEVYGHYKAGVIVGDGLCSRIDKCHVENATVVVTPLNEDDGNHVGAIVGYLSAENEAWVKNCSVKNAEIRGYRDVAAIAGTANQAAVVTGNKVENVTVIADHRPEYKEVKAANAGKFAGRIHANAVLENNTDTDVVIKLYNVTDADLKTVIDNAKEGDTVCVAGEYGKFPAVGKNMTIDATGATFKGNSKLNINGTTVIGATFSNPSGNAVDQTINGIFKSCTFYGSNAIRNGYTGPVCEFEDCVFDGAVYGCHFDGKAGNDLSFTRCTFSGFNALAASIPAVTLNECVFEANGRSGYNGINLWGNSYVNNTTFKFDGRASNQWIGLSNMDGNKEYVFNGCKVLNANNEELPTLLPYFSSLTVGKFVTVDGVEYEYLGNSRFAANGKVYVYNLTGLNAAVANAEADVEVVLCADINGDVTVGQNAGVNVTIDGANFNYGGVIVVNGKSATYTTAGLTIKNLNFNAETISADACIRLGNGDNNTRYTCNVTVEGCTFNIPGAVGVKSYTGGDKNLTIKNCTAAEGTHSLLQAAGIDGILVEGCTVKSKNGLNFNQSDNIVIDSTTAEVRGYAVRFGASSGDGEAAESYLIKNSTLKSACDEAGDAVIVLRGTAKNAVLTLENTNLVGNPVFNNSAAANVEFAATEGTIELAAADYGTITLSELSNATIKGNKDAKVIFNTTADTKIENVTLNAIDFVYDGSNVNCGIVVNAEAQIDNLIIDGCSFTGTGEKKGRGLYGQNPNATIAFKNCTFENLGYPIYTMSAGGYKSLTVTKCNFRLIKSWTVMAQYGEYLGDLTVSDCNFENCTGGLVKTGAFTANHTFTFTNNTIVNSTEHPAKDWFSVNTSAATKIVSGNTKDGAEWTPADAEGLK